MKAQKETKSLGIWMDHTVAHIIEFTEPPMSTRIVESKFTREIKEQSVGKGENLMHNKEQHQQAAFYKELASIIQEYNKVLLFGPTDAKVELFHLLEADHKFDKIVIELKQTDKLSDNQQHAFVRDYFSKHATV